MRYNRPAVIVDNVGLHRSSAVREFFEENRGIRLVYLPKRMPTLNAVEEVWNRVKWKLMVD